jgi:hypothetical protein
MICGITGANMLKKNSTGIGLIKGIQGSRNDSLKRNLNSKNEIKIN